MTNPDLTALGSAIRRFREEADLTQEQAAELAGWHWTHLSGVENGRRNPTYTKLRDLAAALGTSVVMICKAADDARPIQPPEE